MESVENLTATKVQLEKQRFYAGATVLFFAIFGFGWWIGSTNFNSDSCKDDTCKKQAESLKIVVIPIILGIGVASRGVKSLLDLYIEEITNQLNLETLRRKHELEREIPSEYRYSAEMDFLSVYYQKANDVPDTSYEDFCQKIKGFCDSRGGIREKTQKYMEQRHPETIKEVLQGLDRGFSKEYGPQPFLRLATEACNYALKLKDRGKSEKWANPFYEDIMLYLDAWLRCSVQYGFAIPIRPFVLPLRERESGELDEESTDRFLGQEARDHYLGEESYIQAIEYINNCILEDEAILAFFYSSGARRTVKYYLEKLIWFLKDEKLVKDSQNEFLAYAGELPDSL